MKEDCRGDSQLQPFIMQKFAGVVLDFYLSKFSFKGQFVVSEGMFGQEAEAKAKFTESGGGESSHFQCLQTLNMKIFQDSPVFSSLESVLDWIGDPHQSHKDQ